VPSSLSLSLDQLPLRPRILQVSMKVSDLDRADAFYCGVLGLQRRGDHSPNSQVVERFYGPGSHPAETLICLVWNPDEPLERLTTGMSARVSFNLTIADVKGIVARTEAGGGTVLADTITQPAGDVTQDMAFVADPDGNAIELTWFY
jgi:catechol 2,3-dioxygenase-like lactoylglutathione lyase family enzyme